MSLVGTVLGLLALAVNLYVVARRPTAGVAVYVVFAMVAPTVSIAGWPIAYELYALPPIIGLALIRRPRLHHGPLHVALGLFLALLLFSTIAATMRYGSNVDLIRLQGVVRFLVLLVIMVEFLDHSTIEKALLGIVGANAVAGLVQMVVPGTAGLFYALYGRVGQAALERYALEDLIPRASGTFNSPVELGAVALLGVAVAWTGMISREPRPRHRWLLFLAGVAGILSLSKTFILGAPIVLAGGFLLAPLTGDSHPARIRVRTAVLMLGATVATAAAVVFMAGYLQQAGFGVAHYVGYLLDPTEAFSTRYGPGGQLEETIGVIRENPVVGVGVTTVRGEFLGDSTYVWLLHSTGAFGTALAAVGLLLLIHRVLASRALPPLLVVATVLMVGTAFPMVPSLPGAVAIAYVLAATAPSLAKVGSAGSTARRDRRVPGLVG